ncbi:hypothetical protein JRQ81_010531 [Phrynocephalus forsythii]|uniref:F-box only protein 43 n=1 Tax=Phrynocephalus forsythii TaxID=171643 RepID=A0A9Q0Y049_9SAUR|nr:hypothetical protein JRQ81_010531 [Phrynocephalus forsythii]
MSESHSILPNILKRSKLTSPGNNTKYCNFKDTCSPSIFHDSGYNESLKDPSFDTDAEHKGELNKRGLPDYFKHVHSNSLCTSVLSPNENKNNTICLSERKEAKVHTDYFETPRVAKKDLSLRRRLLVSKAASVGALGCSERHVSPLGQSRKKTCLSHFLSFDERISQHALNSPREKNYKPLATSTLKSEDPSSGCQKLRLLFSQQRTSTIDDSKPQGTFFPEPDCLSPIQPKSSTKTSNSFFDSALTSFNDQSICSELVRDNKTNDDKCVTPVNSVVEGFNLTIDEIYTPPTKEISNLSLLTLDSSSCSSKYNSLGFDKSEDSLSEHEGSFQELLQKCRKNKQTEWYGVHQKCNESSFSNSKRKVRKLLRSRRLSTLSERGSQSEKEDCDITLATSKCTLKTDTASINEDHELVFNEDDNKNVVPILENLSGTPALQVVHILFMQSRSKIKQNDLQKNIKGADLSALKCIVAQLIGKKMGIEKLDVLTELRDRDLKHVLAIILDILTVESLCSMWNVSKTWREIVVQDKNANRRRRLYIKQLRTTAKGSPLDAEDAATRLMMTRFALRPVQAQAKSSVLQSQPSYNESLTPLRYSQSTSKQDKYIKVAQTLFSDEALKPCPKCQCPAKYQSLKKRGLCSREDCAFDFCILCLCAFHGSQDCSSLSTKRQNKQDALPGSAKSKKNLKRL